MEVPEFPEFEGWADDDSSSIEPEYFDLRPEAIVHSLENIIVRSHVNCDHQAIDPPSLTPLW